MMRFLLWVFGLSALVVAVIGAWLWQDFENFRATPMTVGAETAVLHVPAGARLGELDQQLVARGWLDRPGYLYWLGRITEQANRIKAGEFQVRAGTTPEQLLTQLVAGKTIQHQLTVIPGWSFAQLMQAVAQSPYLLHELTDTDPQSVMAAIGRPGEHPEGRFFPDTYLFPRGTTDIEFLQRAHRVMRENLQNVWDSRSENLPLNDAYEALILASIIEKETGIAGERAEIAGVFVRRLRKGMLLQTDPTVIYGLGESFDGDLRRRDLRNDTPYNTYTRAGLPPTPIAMPGLASIQAAVQPAPGTSLYFVADGSGGHTFSNTLKEHNRAVRKYQLNQ